MAFGIAFNEPYVQLARAVINALNYYHENPTIIAYTTDWDSPKVQQVRKDYANIELIPFKDLGYNYGSWHPLIWAKIEAFNLDIKESIMFLDVDMIIYRDLSPFFALVENSDKIIGAAKDFAPLVKQFNSGFDFRQFFFNHFSPNEDYLNAPAFNAGALVYRPDKSIYKELIKIAKTLHDVTFYPEQAILNFFCFANNGWLELENFSVMPFSPQILKRKSDIGMLHFFTPRPEFMMKQIIREGEPTLEEMILWFQQYYGEEYPINEIEQEYSDRLNNNIK